jgi:DNA-binding GntR family transcriptional regulator
MTMAPSDTNRKARRNTPMPQVKLDYSSRVPLYFQIAESLRGQIEKGTLKPGSLLGNEIQFAAQLMVSRPTVRKAISLLVEQGLVARRRGAGTVVLPNRVKRRLAVPSLHEDLATSGRRPTTKVLSMGHAAPEDDIVAAMANSDPDRLIQVRRIRYADDAPLALMTNWLPDDLVDFDERDLVRHGLYDLLRRNGVVPRVVDETIGGRLAGRSDAAQLDVNPRDAVLTVSVVSFDAGGRAIDVGRHVYRADRYSFETTHVAP